MKNTGEDVFCPNCEWTGNVAGVTSCPVCGANLSSLSSFSDEELAVEAGKEKYPDDFLSKIDDPDDDYIE